MSRALPLCLLLCAACPEGGLNPLEGDSGTPVDAGGVHPDSGTTQPDGGAQCGGGRPVFPVDAGLRPGMGCGFQDGGHAFPELSKCCTTSADCSLDSYQWICCGQQYVVGFNSSQTTAFRNAVGQWGCSWCDCTPGGMVAEDGVLTTRPVVSCDNGYCMTHAQ